jgi:hypothetical protein
MKSWRELLATPLGPDGGDVRNSYPAVLWPSHRHDLTMDLDMVLFLVRHLTGTLEDEEFEEPSQEQVDEWMIGMSDEESEQ